MSSSRGSQSATLILSYFLIPLGPNMLLCFTHTPTHTHTCAHTLQHVLTFVFLHWDYVTLKVRAKVSECRILLLPLSHVRSHQLPGLVRRRVPVSVVAFCFPFAIVAIASF